MNRVRRIVRIAAAAVAGLLLLVVVAGIIIVQTHWFRNTVRAQIVGAVEDATGGTATVGAFTFDWRHLRAQIRDFTIHGLEPTNSAPLFHANLVQADLKVTSPFHGFVDIAYLLLDTPQAWVIVFPDGHTNIPAPKVQPKSSGKTGLETIVDLAIGHFDLRNGSLSFGDQKTALNASGANFRAQLGYNLLDPSYTGEIDISPLHVRFANNAPLDLDIKLPVTAHKDELQIENAQFSTPQSHIVVSGAMNHLIAPRTSAHLNAQVSLDEARRAAGLTMPLDLAHGPRVLMADVTASMDQQAIHVQSARIGLGNTTLEASGDLKEANGGSGATFNASVDLGELGRLLRVAARPEGIVKLGGTAHLDSQNNYSVNGNIEARRVALRQGETRISNVNLDSSLAVDTHRIALSNLRLDALGGRFVGAASLQDMAAFQVEGCLQGFDIESVSRTFLQRKLGYNGVVSGPIQASGNVNRIADLAASVNLAIAPAARKAEVPVTGRINADYNGRADTVTLGASYIALPHTRVDLSGQLGRQIDVKLVSRNFADFQPLGEIPVTLATGGSATVNATVSGNLSAPHIGGSAAISNFAVQGRPFTSFTANITASPASVAVTNAVVARGNLQMALAASAGLRDWKIFPSSPVRADATVRNADVKDVLALAEEASAPVTGALTVDAHINGIMGSPAGTVDAVAVNGSIDGEKFDNFTLHAQMNPSSIIVPTLSLSAGTARIDVNGVFQHAIDDLRQGTITAHVAANQVQLAQFQSLVKDRPGLQGTVTLNGDGSANLRAGVFDISSLKADVAAHGLAMEGKPLGDLTATANTAGTALRYNISSNFAGSTIHLNGEIEMNGDHHTTASANVSNLPLDRVLAVAGERDLPLKGNLSVTAQVSGTLQDPQATANLQITNGAAYQEPFTRLQADVNYTSRALNVPRFHIEDAASFIDASLAFTHPANDLQNGDVQLHVNSNQIQLARLNALQQSHPGLAGAIQLTADATARLHKNAAPQFSALNANLRATGVSVNKQSLGDLTATATTRGNAVNFNLTSDLAHSDIKGSGSLELTSGFPVNARVTFNNVTYRGLSPLLGAAPPQPFDASLAGSLSVSGPVSDVAELSGNLELTKLEAHSTAPSVVGAQPRVNFELTNAGNVTAALNKGSITIQNFRLTGRDATLSVSGTASLAGNQALGLHVNGNVNLQILEAFSPEIYSSGSITLNAAIAGTASTPDVTGRLQLQNASFNMLELPNGLSNATGTVAFTGTEAYIQNIKGESGGGQVTLSGTVGYAGPQTQFHVQAAATGVHVQYPDTITTEVDANLAINGTAGSSLVTGRVSIVDVSLHSGADIGNVLTQAASPPSSSTGSVGPLAGMRFDVRVVTAPDAQFRTTLTQNLQADAHLTLLGTPDNPGMLGRVTVTEGDVVFFGSKYTIDQGTITFSDASKINPVLNIDLETTVQGVDVALSVSGPMDKMKLSYRSDPPLQFQQIVSLLASGTTPTTDPVLAAHTPAAPQQNLEQSGASTLLGQAVANPVSGRLQRLFGVSKLSIDPQIVGTTNTAQATLTLQQQITRDITFTYIEDITSSNPQVIRAEWAISPRYSAIAQRDVNGEVTVDLFYKRRFH
jgi:translocation and assembly module TamB